MKRKINDRKSRNDMVMRVPNGIREYNYAFSHKCYNCGEDVGCSVIYADKRVIDDKEKYVFYGVCPICGFPAIAIAVDVGAGKFAIEEKFPKITTPDTPKDLPAKVEKLYNEFKDVYFGKKGKTVMTIAAVGRMVLEAVLKDISKTNEGNLLSLIKKLADECVIPKNLYDVAQSVRVLGNKAVHEFDDISIDDADDIWEFVNVFIDYIYVLPSKVDSIKKRHH